MEYLFLGVSWLSLSHQTHTLSSGILKPGLTQTVIPLRTFVRCGCLETTLSTLVCTAYCHPHRKRAVIVAVLLLLIIVEVCNGQCGSHHPHSKIYDRATATFNVTKQWKNACSLVAHCYDFFVTWDNNRKNYIEHASAPVGDNPRNSRKITQYAHTRVHASARGRACANRPTVLC